MRAPSCLIAKFWVAEAYGRRAGGLREDAGCWMPRLPPQRYFLRRKVWISTLLVSKVVGNFAELFIALPKSFLSRPFCPCALSPVFATLGAP
jgi:hypothetical protein